MLFHYDWSIPQELIRKISAKIRNNSAKFCVRVGKVSPRANEIRNGSLFDKTNKPCR